MRRSAVNGVKWTTVEQATTLGIQFIIGVVVARLVSPEDYGLVAMLTIFTAVGNLFINSGFGIALIRSKENSKEDYSTAFFFNIGVALMVYIVLYFCAPLIADFYKIPLLKDVTRVYTLILLIDSFSIVQISKLTHELKFKIQFTINSLALGTSGAIGIFLAYNGYGVWALVWQGLSSSMIKGICYWLFSGWYPIFCFSKKSFKYLFSFGSKILAIGVIDIIYDNIYSLVIGKYYSASSTGYYNRSLHFARLPQNLISQVVGKVALPVLTPYQDNNEKLLVLYEKIFRLTTFISYPIMMLMAVLASPIIYLLLGEKWMPSVPYLQILSISVIFVVLTLVNLNLFYVKGRSDILLKIGILKKIIGFLIVLLVTPMGLKWICMGTIFYSIAAFVINCYQTKKILNYGLWDQLKAIIPSFIYTLIMGAIVFLVVNLIQNAILQLLIGGCLGLLVYLIIAFVFKDKTLIEIKTLLIQHYEK